MHPIPCSNPVGGWVSFEASIREHDLPEWEQPKSDRLPTAEPIIRQ